MSLSFHGLKVYELKMSLIFHGEWWFQIGRLSCGENVKVFFLQIILYLQ